MTSIYEHIGGAETLEQVVADFYERVLADAELAGFFAGANVSRLKGRQVKFFAAALGGPEPIPARPCGTSTAAGGFPSGTSTWWPRI